MTEPRARRWDVYAADHNLEQQLAKAEGRPWDALRRVIDTLEWSAETVGRPLPFPWHQDLRRVPIADDADVYGVAEVLLESRQYRIARLLDVTWLPDVQL
ncbi:hypothetical protein [Streptomyces sp. NPDC049879]|uniref:hypothetical protein n=1 Tax=Streptomyces sp. NPDC049879 TaxID=3365598 RepID=UPI0037A9E163